MTSIRPVSSTLLQEILGFAPELLLDDIVDSANNSIYQCVSAMEPFLRRWMEHRSKPLNETEWNPEAEIEQGLVAFQTLLENHVDIAFDFFDVWCRRNVFTFNPDLPIVVPHQSGLELSIQPEQETEIFTDIEELRRSIDNQRRLRFRLRHAHLAAREAANRSKRRLQTVGFLEPLRDNNIRKLPEQIKALHTSIQSLTDIPPPNSILDPRKRPWESSKEGYLQWAVQKLVERSRAERSTGGEIPSCLASLVEETSAGGSLCGLKELSEMTKLNSRT